MDEKRDLKMTRFENYASFVVMVQILRFMVQKTSILSKYFNENIFGQKFLQFTHKSKLLYPREFHKNRGKSQNFRNYICDEFLPG